MVAQNPGRLSRLSLPGKHLTVEATSVSSERLCSTPGNTVTVKCAQLKYTIVEDPVFLH